ncbi:MAG: AraC family transcriptional regulator [Rhizobium sp.]|uniref:helix-turn-helix domain-containing protein n=1 Tax=Ciceribacter sp. T2.26MG-112.2 TaxID=3137154 RepID=UPI0012B687D9|nr:AraC family transcriptional regulator [Ciceribacter naphthalenivorans]MCA1970864.1 AraC family transcriptional regulator [Rhizobium sp.]
MRPDAYCFHQSFEPAGPSEFRMDRHYLLYAMEGTIRLEANGRRWTLPPARAALITAGHPITISILSRLTCASVLYTHAFAPPPPQVLSVFDVSPLARELIAECREWGLESGPLSPYAQRIFETLVAVCMRLAETPSPCVLPAPASPALARALALTEELADGTPVFAEIAKATGQSPRALARRFSTEMGMTWREALRRIRLIRAVEALASSDAPITEIALGVGYNSLSAFNTAFRDLMGKGPREYRASFRD